MEGKFHISKRMAQDVVISILLYTLLLFILKNWETTAMSLPEDEKNNGMFLQSGQATLEGLARKYKKSQGRTLTREKSKHLKKLSEGFYKFKLAGKPKVYNYMLSKGWGAGGMPFNVLYTPNTRQQKILKSVPKKTSEGYKAYTTTGLNDGEPPMIQNEKILKKHSTPRKYYSFIPHFFVSYGW